MLHERAGSSTKIFANGRRDEGRKGESFADFVNHRHAKTAQLSDAHVLALRLYTTAAFVSLNVPLRELGTGQCEDGGDLSPERSRGHQFPITIKFVTEAIKQLRAIEAQRNSERDSQGAPQPELWRGLRDVDVRRWASNFSRA